MSLGWACRPRSARDRGGKELSASRLPAGLLFTPDPQGRGVRSFTAGVLLGRVGSGRRRASPAPGSRLLAPVSRLLAVSCRSDSFVVALESFPTRQARTQSPFLVFCSVDRRKHVNFLIVLHAGSRSSELEPGGDTAVSVTAEGAAFTYPFSSGLNLCSFFST